MEMHIQKIGMFRPDINPKSCNLDLDLDWSIDYTNLNSNCTEYIFRVQNLNKFPLNFKIEGFLSYNDSEEFSESVSPLILNKGLKIIVKMINLTKECSLDHEESEYSLKMPDTQNKDNLSKYSEINLI
ncbi:hypothetical protein [Methanobacterium alcaliphilum]|uniref:hypothetical protein n=1 Tax=Methanobacterium alcaliphilum TaxID=392018 RepID=UPI00200A4258|nr:hypothetical protein [Methanobacterium alcaliphilum]MCK9152534.1 hypothetical protein [Methanobacterium alcaliphilum]